MPLRRLHKHFFTSHQDHPNHHQRHPEPASQSAITGTSETTIPSSQAKSPDAAAPTIRLDSANSSALHSMQPSLNAASKHVLPRTATIRSVPSFEGSESSHESPRYTGSFASALTSKASGLSVIANGDLIERTPSPGAPSPGSRNGSSIHGHWNITPTKTATPITTTSIAPTIAAATAPASDSISASPSSTPIPATSAMTNSTVNGNSVRLTTTAAPRASSSDLNPCANANANLQRPDTATLSDSEQDTGGGMWDSTIGKAGLGKTGRVINKLVGDNDALKRELQIERLKADEAKQAAKLLEDKMERLVSDYESRLLEADVTKMMLSRKERQVETLTAAVELERKKSQSAQELERGWRDEMGKAKAEAKERVDEATSYAQLMEGRYNAISSHWRGQGEEVNRAVGAIRGEINGIVEERRSDDEKIQALRELCEQQDCNIKALRREKDDIGRLFEEYKRTQEDDLRDIKTTARSREEEQERLLQESREALDKLKWALNVEKNVKLR